MAGELAGHRVLVVEDEFFVAVEIEDALVRAGAEVVGPIPSLADALEQAGRDGFDLAVLDINLGGDLVYPLADALQDGHVPFVFASAYPADDMPPRHRSNRRVEKPYDTRALVHALAELSRAAT